ncbi:DNA polymerase III subunit delta [Marivivens niveibacter]|uniref:DNA-directed DNA polymerase n=1 Tax=Marivivens niveibacter TaxID=1930667 RepID=A0A251WZJ8_9RHOB|nr:DNA polymerase III subunit delta [Marivivens niveibacter]OUD09558.1 DNA polymerase III subunit delta [Marivivens niveibacter]
MKLNARDAAAYFRKPDPHKAGLLIFGADAMRVALRRKEVIDALVGPQGEEEMRLTRMSGGELRKDGALLNDAIKAQGFFPGPRVAFVEDATDGLTATFEAALSDWRDGDAQIIVTAGQLAAKSKLRKLFEGHPATYCVGIYDDPPGRDEIEATLAKSGVSDVSRDAMDAILGLSRMLDPGDFRQTIEKLGLYKLNDASPVSVEDVDACRPQSAEAGLDDLLKVVANGQAQSIAPLLRRLYAQGVNPTSLCIGANRHFRTLHAAACDPGGPAAGVGRLRPPVFGPRRDAIVRQASAWGRDKLERALSELLATDLTLRSTSRAPQQALMERALVRLAMMAKR